MEKIKICVRKCSAVMILDTNHVMCQVSKNTAQLLVACMVKTREGSRAMEGLKTASTAVTRATDALVRAAQRTIKKPATPTIKVDRFKQVSDELRVEIIERLFIRI